MKQLWTNDQYQLFVFDAYGTLFYVSLDTPEIVEASGGKAEVLGKLWYKKQLEYTRLRSLMGRWANFDDIIEDALDYTLDTYGLPQEGELKQLMLQQYRNPQVYPDVIRFLEILKEEQMPAVILSNGTHENLEGALHSAGIKDYFKSILSAEDVEVYTPSPMMYRLVQQMEKVQAEEVVFWSANSWDIAGAGTAGFTTVWVNRWRKKLDRLGVTPTFEVDDLEDAI